MKSLVRKTYRNDLDLIKGFAIWAVILYHLGISKSGYLGVDVFFVVSGFLIVPEMVRDICEGRFHYFSFIEKLLTRLLPLMLLVSALTLVVGYWGMLPDDYENLSESVVATNFFSNNILSYITRNDYWGGRVDYKALMHTWYIGVLFEFYLILPLVLLFEKWLSTKLHFSYFKYTVITIIALSVISFLIYLNPTTNARGRFYLLPYRFFELAFGGLAGIWIVFEKKGKLYKNGILSTTGLLLLLLVIFVGVVNLNTHRYTYYEYDLISGSLKQPEYLIPQNILLLLAVIFTVLLIVSDNMQSRLVLELVKVRFVCLFGAMSYSFFMWHQPILAFYRYYVTCELTPSFVLLFSFSLLSLSYVTYRFVEKRIKVGKHTRVIFLFAFLFINGLAFAIYMHAGVVRDVPELNVYANDIHRRMHADYVDRNLSYAKGFPAKNGKKNVLVIGNSFASDMGNILLESKMNDRINMRRLFYINEKKVDMIKQADYLFVFGWKHDIPYYFWDNLKPGAEVWGIGTKNFGESNGIIYKNRFSRDYFHQTVKINPNFVAINEQLKDEWKNNYIDLLGLSLVRENEVIVFSQDHKLISQDTLHLTKGGAEFFANKIDFDKIFHENDSN